MFERETRDRLRAALVARAEGDPRVVAAAAVGSSAEGGDRWSDLDLTFGVGAGATVAEVLADWTRAMVEEFGAAVLFDLPVEATIYRVFLLPGALQVDLSFSPAAAFGARGPRFRLLFGEAVERPWAAPAPAAQLLGMGVHHVVRARVCLERGRVWQAEHWLHAARDDALALACRRHGLDGTYGRGFDRLPADELAAFAGALPARADAGALRRALAVVTATLLREAEGVAPDPERLRAVVAPILDADVDASPA